MRSQALRSAPGAQQAKAVGVRRAAKQVRENEREERGRERRRESDDCGSVEGNERQKRRWLFFSLERRPRGHSLGPIRFVSVLALLEDIETHLKQSVDALIEQRRESAREEKKVDFETTTATGG